MSAISKLPARWRALAVACALHAGALAPAARAVEPPPDCQPADPRIFTDVAFNHPSCAWIEELARHAISAGCAAGKYCPDDPVTRGQLALLLERVMRGTDNWTSAPRIRFGCSDLDGDCTEPENDPVSVDIFLDDPAYLGTEHLVRIWVSDAPTFSAVSPDPVPLFSYAAQFPSATANVYQRVIGAPNSMNVTLTMSTAGTRYLMVEIGGRIFVSPALVWGPGPT